MTCAKLAAFSRGAEDAGRSSAGLPHRANAVCGAAICQRPERSTIRRPIFLPPCVDRPRISDPKRRRPHRTSPWRHRRLVTYVTRAASAASLTWRKAEPEEGALDPRTAPLNTMARGRTYSQALTLSRILRKS